ncbi:hypothetical protein GCM10027162_64200 [Streptomyces incanus]
MEAAERFRHGDENAVIAHDLRLSVRSVQRRRKACSQGGPRALAAKGPASLPLLKGPVAHGRPDQPWTLSRIKTLIGRRFHQSYTGQSVAALLKRHGRSCQIPARRAIERNEAAVAGWVKETWPSGEGPGRRSTPGSSSRTRPASRCRRRPPAPGPAAATPPWSASEAAPAAADRSPPWSATSPTSLPG